MASAASGGGAGGSLFGSLRRFDAYPKTMEDFRIKTCGGAASELNSKSSHYVYVISYFSFALHMNY